jgi:hypothetical protein
VDRVPLTNYRCVGVTPHSPLETVADCNTLTFLATPIPRNDYPPGNLHKPTISHLHPSVSVSSPLEPQSTHPHFRALVIAMRYVYLALHLIIFALFSLARCQIVFQIPDADYPTDYTSCDATGIRPTTCGPDSCCSVFANCCGGGCTESGSTCVLLGNGDEMACSSGTDCKDVVGKVEMVVSVAFLNTEIMTEPWNSKKEYSLLQCWTARQHQPILQVPRDGVLEDRSKRESLGWG